MSFMPDFSRRGFIRLAAAAPLLGQLAAKNVLASAASALGKDSRQNVFGISRSAGGAARGFRILRKHVRIATCGKPASC